MIAEERRLDWNNIQILFSRDVNEQLTRILDQLPTLDDVLYRKSQPPICLYNYYIVLRDRLGLETLLDFWLDVSQADLLYKRYIKNSTSSSKQSEQALQSPQASSSHPSYNTIQRASQLTNLSSSTEATTLSMPSLPLAQQNTNNILTTLLLSHPRPSTTTTIHSSTAADRKPRKPLPTREEMVKTIERIYLRYIVPNAEKEIDQLPQPIKDTIGHHFHNYYSRSLANDPTCPDNPIIYVQAKEYVHQLLQSTFIIFLYYKVLMNLTLPQQIGRLACGLFSLFIGFSLEFSLIFLDIRPWQKRLWGMLPIMTGVFCVITSITGIDPVGVLLLNISETTPFKFNRILQPKAKVILQKKSLQVLSIILFVTLLLMVPFCAVEGKRL